jgi:hypothetical protein
MGWLREVTSGGDGGFGPKAPPAQLVRLRAYWDDMRGQDLMPRRSDFAPGAVPDLLDICMLVERIAPGQARIRLAGMHLSDLIGMELRGMPLFTLFTPDCRTRVQPLLERVFAQPSVARFQLEAERGIFKPSAGAEMLIMPMRDAEGHPTRALIGLASDATAGRTPRRFALSGYHLELLGPQIAPVATPPRSETPNLRLVHSRA